MELTSQGVVKLRIVNWQCKRVIFIAGSPDITIIQLKSDISSHKVFLL
jgi:hypothetical protein